MASASLPRYITVAEFDAMEFDPDREYELIDGEIVEVSHPSYRHYKTAERLAKLLRAAVGSGFDVGRELPYVLAPGTKRKADVAIVAIARDNAAEVTRSLDGAPELVVEIVSPSNLSWSDRRTARLCLRNGAMQFWMVYIEDRVVDVRRRDNLVTSYERGSRIALPEALGGGEISVDDIFPPDQPPLS